MIGFFLKNSKHHFISIDNYSTGRKSNHIKSKRIKYIKGDTINIGKILNSKKNIKSIFHFSEFSRIFKIFKNFKNFDQCYASNTIRSKSVFKFCLDNNIRLIYSATSATLGNLGEKKFTFACSKTWHSKKKIYTILVCYEAWKKKYLNYSGSNKKSYSIIDIANMIELKEIFTTP